MEELLQILIMGRFTCKAPKVKSFTASFSPDKQNTRHEAIFDILLPCLYAWGFSDYVYHREEEITTLY